jgi:hypothetical protein
MKTYITKEFIQLLLDTYPGLANNKSYWHLMRVLLFGIRNEGRPLLAYRMLSHCYHYDSYCKGFNQSYNHNFNALAFLQAFKKDVMNDFNWTESDHIKHKARTALITFTPEVQAALEAEIYLILNDSSSEDKVHIITGVSYNKKDVKKQQQTFLNDINTLNSLNATAEQKPLLDYLNNKVSELQLKNIIEPNLFDCAIAMNNIEDSLKRQIQLSGLCAISEYFKAFYQPSAESKTVRIFPANMSILCINKEYKKILLNGCTEVDLASSQLAIVSETWNIPFIKDYLNSGNKIWLDLCAALEIDYDAPNKKVLKEALYSLVFGMTLPNLQKSIKAAFGESAVSKWEYHPVIQSLLMARTIRMNEILTAGKLTTIYGKEVLITGKTKADKADSLRSALAQEAQAVEYYLMQPVYEIAKTTDDFVIILWQHDGCTIKFNDKSKQQRWMDRICLAVKNRADSLSIPTQLEIEIL